MAFSLVPLPQTTLGDASSAFCDIRFLNKGSFGSVHTAVHRLSGRRLAVKEMVKTEQSVDALRREAQIAYVAPSNIGFAAVSV
jgi:hypothetical protein